MLLQLLLLVLLACEANADVVLSVSQAFTDCSNSSSLLGGMAVRATSATCTPTPCTDGVVSLTTCVPFRDTIIGLFPKTFAYQASYTASECSSGLAQVRFFLPGASVSYGIYSQGVECFPGGLNLTTCNTVFGQCRTNTFKTNQCADGVIALCP